MKKMRKTRSQKRLFYYITLLFTAAAVMFSLFTSSGFAGYFSTGMTTITAVLFLGVFINNDIILEDRTKGRKLFLIAVTILWINVILHATMQLIVLLLNTFTNDAACTGFFGAPSNCSINISIIELMVFISITPISLLIAAMLSLAAAYGKRFGKLTLR